jgi:hypothetical protein
MGPAAPQALDAGHGDAGIVTVLLDLYGTGSTNLALELVPPGLGLRRGFSRGGGRFGVGSA